MFWQYCMRGDQTLSFREPECLTKRVRFHLAAAK